MKSCVFRRSFAVIALSIASFLGAGHAVASGPERAPNIVLIVADDLGWGDLGCYGQTKIKTPNIDRIASEGIRFNRAYSGNAVCAPSRCCLMTGKHPGHAFVRDNRQFKPTEQWSGQVPLPEGTVTLPGLMKARGYSTAAMGKWGLGAPGNSGDPKLHGVDHFFGYYCQAHAHNYYPRYVWRNGMKVDLQGNEGIATGKTYTHDLCEAESLSFVRQNKDRPFFLFLPFTVPHLALQVPDDSLAEYAGKFPETPYKGKAYQHHDQPRAAYAAMITRMDRSIGRLLKLLEELKIDSNTLIVFTSDNGPIGGLAGTDADFFNSRGNLRGMKGSLYEGGIRVPLLVRWPGKIRPGRTTDHLTAFWDVLPTLCDVAGIEKPKDTDGLSWMPLLFEREQPVHKHLYWEFPGYRGQQAVREGKWKAVRQEMIKGSANTELYDLERDPTESKNVARDNQDLVKRLETIMKDEHVPSREFPLPSIDPNPKKK